MCETSLYVGNRSGIYLYGVALSDALQRRVAMGHLIFFFGPRTMNSTLIGHPIEPARRTHLYQQQCGSFNFDIDNLIEVKNLLLLAIPSTYSTLQ